MLVVVLGSVSWSVLRKPVATGFEPIASARTSADLPPTSSAELLALHGFGAKKAEELGVNRDYFLSHPDYSNRDLIYLHGTVVLKKIECTVKLVQKTDN